MSLETHLHRVRELRRIGGEIFELVLERDGVVFVPGDCLALFARDGVGSRPYSISSGVDDPDLVFLIRHLPGGEVSGYLASLQPGDMVKASLPFGWFRPGETLDSAPFIFVATGTGISPFLSHLRSRPRFPPAQFFHGVRNAADRVPLPLDPTACELHVAVSREEVPGTHHGRVTGMLDRMRIDPACHYYLCGLDEMIDEVTRWLEARGIPLKQIHRECFFNALYE